MSFDLKKSLPKPGARFVLPALHGSADACVLAQAAAVLKAQGRMLTVIAAVLMVWPSSHDDTGKRVVQPPAPDRMDTRNPGQGGE